jgi:predicted nucleotidyltransferase
MSDSSLNISGKIDSGTVALYESVSDAASRLEIPVVVVGASARDIVLHYGHNARIQRATTDVDFGIQVPDWSAFEALKDHLLESGFSETRAQHRVLSPGNVQVDIVPFGPVEDEESNIAWPPDGDWVSVCQFGIVCCFGEFWSISLLAAFDLNIVINDLTAILADEFID